MHAAAADDIANRLPLLVLEFDVALHGLPHGEPRGA